MIYEFVDYRKYLESRLGKKGSRNGLRKQLAHHMRVHTTFVSQVLLGKADLSVEQAEDVNTYLKHIEEEGEYFIYLVMCKRAGNQLLRKRLDKKIQKIRQQRLNIKDRLKVDVEVDDNDRLRFYSNYYYGAIHVLVSLKGFRTEEALAKALKLPLTKIKDMVTFMLKLGVLESKNNELTYGQRHIHLGTDSELILKHHTNWRMHAINSLNFIDENDFHYSACLTISQKDAFKVKDALLGNLQDNIKLISQSREEVAYVYNIDFHKLIL